MTISIADARSRLPFTRLAHFTPALNLLPILRDGSIRSSKDLADNTPESFTPTDHLRLDAHPNHLCCSFEYPNVYYLRQARQKAHLRNYPDWVCLLLDPALITRAGTLFCGCNAARDYGAHIHEGGEALLDLWASPSVPRRYYRGARHHPAVPTDLQAEALIPGPVALSDIQAIVVADEGTAVELFAFYSRMGHRPDRLEWRIAPLFFDVGGLVSRLHNGGEVEEVTWRARGER